MRSCFIRPPISASARIPVLDPQPRDDLVGYWGECGPVHNLTVRNNDCENMKHTFFDFRVPFAGRAVLEGNNIRGRNSAKAYSFGPGVKVEGLN